MRLRASVIAIAVLSPLSAFAQETPPPAAPSAAPSTDAPVTAPNTPTTAAPMPSPAEAPALAAPASGAPIAAMAPAGAPKSWKELVTIDGLVDSYFMANLTGAAPNKSLMTPDARQFDTNSNTFTLNYAKVGIGVSADNVGLRIDMGYGAMGNAINGATTAPLPFVVQQAYATLAPLDSNFTIDFGKFVTTAGAEVIEANRNWLYSRSFLFFNIPLVHTGMRVGYKINDMVSVQGSIVNGWNGQGFEVDANTAKTFGLSASLTLPGGIGVIPTVYIGKEAGSSSTRVLADVVATYAAGPLGLNLNIDYIKDSGLTPLTINPFFGVAAMGHYAVNEHINATLRVEYAQEKRADVVMMTSNTAKLYEVTVGAALPMAGRFEFRPEFRYDGSDQMFSNGKKYQATLLAAFLAWF